MKVQIAVEVKADVAKIIQALAVLVIAIAYWL